MDNYLKWSESGAAEGELIFVSGHPGRTERADTMAHILYQRDLVVPGTLNLLRRREVLLKNYSDRSAENARRAEDDLFSIQNSRKAYLRNPRRLARSGGDRKNAMRKRNCATRSRRTRS